VLVVALGVPVAAAVNRPARAAPGPHLAAGRGPRTTPRPPRAYRLIRSAGLAELAAFQVMPRPRTRSARSRRSAGFLVVMAGLVIAGPWLTMVGARLLARAPGGRPR